MPGLTGKLLRVDLTSGASRGEIQSEWRATMSGGRAAACSIFFWSSYFRVPVWVSMSARRFSLLAW